MSILGARYGTSEMVAGLKKSEKITYTANGNRSKDAKQLLKKIAPILPRIGVTRTGEISQLAIGNFPVFQSSRPYLYGHTDIGQNSGSQGKGAHADQAKASCLMETIEGYCMEPRNENLIRGSFRYLKKHQVILDPKKYIHQYGVAKVKWEEPLMWTWALHFETMATALVPAEHAFFPFLPRDYKTRSIFPASSNGIAAGSSYLEAVIHGMYEVIERHYYGLWEMDKLVVEHLTGIDDLELVRGFKKMMGNEFNLRLFCLRVPGKIKNIAMIVCFLTDLDGQMYAGYGCCANVDIAIHRAVSEALQSHSILISGTREDMVSTKPGQRDAKAERTPAKYDRQYYRLSKTLALREYGRRVHDHLFKDLKSEYAFLLGWVHEMGFKHVLAVNLTRHGIDVPVVKVLIPGMLPMFKTRQIGFDMKTYDVNRMMYRF